ncbi:type III-A CRISPR-associated protein Csm2 [Methanocaldococcus sp.]
MKKDNSSNNKYVNIDSKLSIILYVNENNVKDFLETAENFARKNLKGITFTKLRKFYDYVDKISTKDKNWFVKFGYLKPMVAYHYGKERKNQGLSNLKILIDKVFENINKEKDENKRKYMFKNFKMFFEAVVAYKRYIEGK